MNGEVIVLHAASEPAYGQLDIQWLSRAVEAAEVVGVDEATIRSSKNKLRAAHALVAAQRLARTGGVDVKVRSSSQPVPD